MNCFNLFVILHHDIPIYNPLLCLMSFNKFCNTSFQFSIYFQYDRNNLANDDHPEQPLHPQCTHSTIFPSSSFVLGTLQMQFVAKFVSRV